MARKRWVWVWVLLTFAFDRDAGGLEFQGVDGLDLAPMDRAGVSASGISSGADMVVQLQVQPCVVVITRCRSDSASHLVLFIFRIWPRLPVLFIWPCVFTSETVLWLTGSACGCG